LGTTGKKIMMHSREIIRMLEADGWRHVSTEGDHWHYKHPVKPGKVSVVHPCKDCSPGMLKSLEKQSGIQLRKRG